MPGFFRWGSAPDASPSSPWTPTTNFSTTGPARPIRLVCCDEKGKFRMHPEAVATLQHLKGPFGLVSVCGRAGQGKSFILNRFSPSSLVIAKSLILGVIPAFMCFLASEESSGFQVASTYRPCIQGLWLWSAPIKRTALDGTEYNLLLVDSEGIDAYIQTITCSYTTRKHIHVRASGGRTTASELGQFSPIFVWLLRDFYLDSVEDNRRIMPRDYLELALRPVQGSGRDIAAKTELEKLRPEFRSGLDALTRFVFERTRPKLGLQ
ncbi:Guanylate-binding protein, N-terminal [Dillenia turbinata]|uniref:Guanylate-binding protein, N-terminal n=1 Tax=Dillenia turbinata TaxID=194707 RepID=A0AAN8YYR9_9MAGN